MKHPLRILLLTPHLGGGGAEKVIALLARGLSKAQGLSADKNVEKYDVHLGLVTQGTTAACGFPAGVAVHALAAPRVRAGALGLLKLVRKLRPRVVVSGMFHLNFLVLLLRPLFPAATQVIIRQNGTLSASLAFDGLPFYTRFLYRLLYRRADRVICQSAAMAEELAVELGVAQDRLAVLANPVEVDDIRARVACLPDQWNGPGPHLLAVGRLSREKGLDLLLGALTILRRKYGGADLVIAGAGPEEARLRALCNVLGLESSVRFAGHVKEPWVFYPGATAFVLSSRHEGLPNALLEAAAAGLPIVATPASQGLVDLLQGKPGAWVAAEPSSESLAAALIRALDSLASAQRFEHSFIDAFRADRAIAAFATLIETLTEAQTDTAIDPVPDRRRP
jgi:glycosyltransferase involved in cell wall biosynthesis